MPQTKRQKIASVIVAAIKTIKIADGFETDLGNSPVEDWRTDWQEDELPGVSVCDLTAERIEDLCEEHLDFFKLPVQIRTSFSSGTRVEQARRYIGDVLKSLRPLKDGFRTGTENLATRVDLTREGFVLAEDGFSVAAVAVEIEIVFYTERFNAYQ